MEHNHHGKKKKATKEKNSFFQKQVPCNPNKNKTKQKR
jgi:hypothetical protein